MWPLDRASAWLATCTACWRAACLRALAAWAAALACCCSLRTVAAEGSGATSVPTGLTWPAMWKPQFSRCSPAVISLSGVQCSTVTISVTPLRRAMPM